MKRPLRVCGPITHGLSAVLGLIAGAVLAGPALAQCGEASWYALTSQTASGEMMNPEKLTAAHKTLSFGTKLRVTNTLNGRSVVVRINDRGPFAKGRIIDLSKAAGREIGIIRRGHAPVCIEPVG